MFLFKQNYLFIVAVFLFFPLAVFAAWTEPISPPPGGNVGVPIYSAGGVGQTVDSSLTVGVISSPTTLQGVGSTIGVQGASPQYAVYGATAAGAPAGFAGVYGTAADATDFAGNFSGGAGLAVQGGTMPAIAGTYVLAAGGELVSTGGYALGSDVLFNTTNKGLVWQRLDGQWLRGVYVNAGTLTVKGFGAGVNVTDQDGNARLTVSEAGAVNVVNGPLTVGNPAVAVCLQNGSGCPAPSTPTLQTVTNAGNVTTQNASFGNYVWAGINNQARLGEIYGNNGLFTSGTMQFDTQTGSVFRWTINNSEILSLNSGGDLRVYGSVGINMSPTGSGAKLAIAQSSSVEGIKIIQSGANQYSPISVRNAGNNADIFRVNEAGNLRFPGLIDVINDGTFYLNSYGNIQLRFDSNNNAGGGNTFGINNGGNTRLLTLIDSGRFQLNPQTNAEGLRILTSNFSPLNIMNNAGTADIFRVDQTGTLAVGSVPWARLTTFPAACPAGQYVTAVGTTLTCTAAAVTGAGTSNYVTKWTSATALGNSVIYDDGSKVGLGLTNPSALLHVKPSNGVEGVRIISSNFSPLVIRNSADNADFFRVSETGRVTIDSADIEDLFVNGNVSIAGQVSAINLLATQKAGVGVVSLTETLEVADSSAGTARLRLTDTGQNPELQLKYGAGGSDHWAIYNEQSDDSLRIWRNSNVMTITQSGNIGIGVSPTRKFEIKGDPGASGEYLLVVQSPTQGANIALVTEQSAGNYAAIGYRRGSVSGNGWNSGMGPNNDNFVIQSRIGNTNTDRLIIDNSNFYVNAVNGLCIAGNCKTRWAPDPSAYGTDGIQNAPNAERQYKTLPASFDNNDYFCTQGYVVIGYRNSSPGQLICGRMW